jgi:hypothetical protein
MDRNAEFEHEPLPDAKDLFVGYRTLLANYGAYQEGDGIHTEAESFVLDGASLPLEVQTLVEKVEFVPAFDDHHSEPDSDYLLVTLPPNPRGLIRSVQIWCADEQFYMEAWDRYETDEKYQDVEVIGNIHDEAFERLRKAITQDNAPTESEVRRMGRVLSTLQRYFPSMPS